MSLATSKPSYWYLATSLLLGVTAYPSVTWLPNFVERFRYAGNGLLPFHLLFTRHMGGLIAVLSIVFLGLFILSAFKPALHSPLSYKTAGLSLIIVYSVYGLLLLASLATP